MNKTILLQGLAALACGIALGASPPASLAQAGSASAPAAAAASEPLAEGEVRRIDLDGLRITLRHGEIRSLEMPPMTMVFTVGDRALLDGLKPGDKVRFKVVSEKGKLVITQIEAQR